MTSSSEDPAQQRCRVCSASHKSPGAGISSSANGLPCVCGPLTPMELTNTNRETPAAIAARASRSVPVTLTRLISACLIGSPRGFECALPARCNTQLAPASFSDHRTSDAISGTTTHFTLGIPRSTGCLTHASTPCPASAAAAVALLPTNPVAPVMTIFATSESPIFQPRSGRIVRKAPCGAQDAKLLYVAICAPDLLCRVRFVSRYGLRNHPVMEGGTPNRRPIRVPSWVIRRKAVNVSPAPRSRMNDIWRDNLWDATKARAPRPSRSRCYKGFGLPLAILPMMAPSACRAALRSYRRCAFQNCPG